MVRLCWSEFGKRQQHLTHIISAAQNNANWLRCSNYGQPNTAALCQQMRWQPLACYDLY